MIIPKSERSSASKPLSQYMSDLLAIQESYDWSYPIQLTRNWSDFRWLNFPRWSEIFSMKPFVFDSALVDPLDIALRDQMEFFIEKISDFYRLNTSENPSLTIN